MKCEEVIEIAGAYGALMVATTSASFCGIMDDQSGFDAAIKELRVALDAYKSIVPTAMQDEIIQTQAPEQSLEVLEKLLLESE